MNTLFITAAILVSSGLIAKYYIINRRRETSTVEIVCNSETHGLGAQTVSGNVTEGRILVGTYDVDPDCGCQWSVVGVESGQVFLGDFLFENGQILARVVLDGSDQSRTTRFITRHRGLSGTREDYFDVTQAAASVVQPPSVDCHSETHRLYGFAVSGNITDGRILVGTYDVDPDCGCQWSVSGVRIGTDFLRDFLFENGQILARVVVENNTGEERTTRYNTRHTGAGGTRDDFFDVTQVVASGFSVDIETGTAISRFSHIVTVPWNGPTCIFLKQLISEAHAQFNGTTANGLPHLYQQQNFPTIVSYYGSTVDREQAWDSLTGWLTALLLTELCPTLRNSLISRGYTVGANKDVDIYKYAFASDPNIARLVASVIYAAMKGTLSPDIASMRTELGTLTYNKSLHTVAEDSFVTNRDTFFYTDCDTIPTAPGPYVSGYTNRAAVGGEPYPTGNKTNDGNLLVDLDIYYYVVANYNLDDQINRQAVIQALADKEGHINHIVGDNQSVDGMSWHPVFGVDTIGERIDPAGSLAAVLADMFEIGLMSRRPFMEGSYYGRRRPGQSATDGLSKSDIAGVLINQKIDEHDGRATGYNAAGDLQYVTDQQHSVYANSYPSGHSSGIWAAALALIQKKPEKADLIMRAAGTFALGRQICRYHWCSDTIIGRVLGSAIYPMACATSDYVTRLGQA